MSDSELRLDRHPLVVADLRRLPRSVAEQALRIIVGLVRDPRRGDWLSLDERTGDLSDCRKIAFGPDEDGLGPSYRIVYRLDPDMHDPDRIYIVTVGEKRAFWAYLESSARLDRHRDPRPWWE